MKSFFSFFARLWFGLLDLFLPVRCLYCDKIVDSSRWTMPVCFSDLQLLPRIEGPVCRVCGLPLGHETFELGVDIYNDPAPACGDCRHRKNLLQFTLAPFAYTGKMRKLIHTWKFGGKKNRGRWLGWLLAKNLPPSLPDGDWDGFVPVPLDFDRQKKRGFNQALQLAERLGERYNLPCFSFLQKKRHTRAQSLLDRKERLENPRDSFTSCSQGKIKDKNLIIIDDIYTTGATLRAAAGTLLEEGARQIGAVVLARSLPSAPDFGQQPPGQICLPF